MGRPGRKRVSRFAMTAAAVGITTSVAGLAATQPASISTPLVDLTALIVAGSSTNPTGAGIEDFFDGRYRDATYTGDGTDVVRLNFLTGPWGIAQALAANADDPANAIVSNRPSSSSSATQLLSSSNFGQPLNASSNASNLVSIRSSDSLFPLRSRFRASHIAG